MAAVDGGDLGALAAVDGGFFFTVGGLFRGLSGGCLGGCRGAVWGAVGGLSGGCRGAVFFLPYPCRGLTGWGGGWRQEKGGRLAAGKGGGGWRLLTGRRLIAHRAAVRWLTGRRYVSRGTFRAAV